MTWPVSRTAALLLAVVAAAGCGRSANRESPQPSASVVTSAEAGGGHPQESPHTSSTAATASPISKPGTGKPRGSRLIKWIQNFTPSGGHGSTAEGAYINFMQRDCWATLSLARHDQRDETVDSLDEPLRSLYEGTAAACLAAFHGQADMWTTAQADRRRLTASQFSCWDRSVFNVLDALIDAHRADSSATFTRGKGGVSQCPELTEVVPDHGSRVGGYEVEIRGRNLPSTLGLRWGDHLVTAHRSGEVLIAVVPSAAPDDSDLVLVAINGAYRIEFTALSFTYGA
jgi:hypothetical protein